MDVLRGEFIGSFGHQRLPKVLTTFATTLPALRKRYLRGEVVNLLGRVVAALGSIYIPFAVLFQ
jgi:hypothetical protein